MKPHKIVLSVAVAACLACAYGCSTLSKIGAGSFVVVIDAQSGGVHVAHGRTSGDGKIALYRAEAAIVIRVLNTDGITVVEYPVAAGKTGLIDRSQKYKKSFEPTEKLPLWALEPLFPDGGRATARLYGFEFEDSTSSTPTVTP